MGNPARRSSGWRPSAAARSIANVSGAAAAAVNPDGRCQQHNYTGAQRIIEAQGYTDLKSLGQADATEGCTLHQAKTNDGAAVIITAIPTSSASHATDVVSDVLDRSGLSHPHLLAAKSVFRQGNWLCIVQDFANGGDLFSLARRCGNDGLPESTARFLIQQVALTFAFAHHYGISMQDISPSKLLISWSPKKMPILKVNLMKTLQKLLPPSDQAGGKVMGTATMYSSVHWLRESIGLRDRATQAAAAEVCDLWSLAVTLYFLLFRRWPFSKAQIGRWVHTAPCDWTDDASISYERASRPAPSDEIVTFLRAVFATGRTTLTEVTQRAAGRSPQPTAPQPAAPQPTLTLAAAIQTPWFLTDLPDGAAAMNASCRTKTEERRASPQFAELSAALRQITGVPSAG